MLSIMLANLTVLCIYAYAVCVPDNDGAIVEPTQSTHVIVLSVLFWKN